MPLLNEADAVYLGDEPVDAVYLGDTKVWPSRFDPLSLGGCVLFLDAADVPPGAVTAWSDRSLSANHLATWMSVPTSNGQYVSIRTDTPLGTTQPLPISGNDPSHLFIVIRSRRLLGACMGWGQPYNGGLWDLYQTDGDVVLWHGYGAGYSQGMQAYSPDVWHVVDLSYDGALSVWLGVDDNNRVGSDNVGGINTGVGTLNLGRGQYNPNADFDISDLILYDRKLPDVERQQVKEYLRTKRGL